MKKISIGVDVFAKIWALRVSGESSEDEILRRVLVGRAIPLPSSSTLPSVKTEGYWDKRSGTYFHEGFEIFREYKGGEYRAIATSGVWRLADGRTFNSINELSKAVSSASENAWFAWWFRASDNSASRIAELRDPTKIGRRNRRGKLRSTIDDSSKGKDMEYLYTWRDDVVKALKEIGGKGALNQIYSRVITNRKKRGASLPNSTEAIIRRELEYNSTDSTSYQGRFDLFYSVDGIGSGEWGLRTEEV